MKLLELWEKLAPLPGGKWLFGFLLGKKVPYSGTISPQIRALSSGYALVAMRDRRRVRNHLNSIHAVALMNLAELTSGLAMVGGLPTHLRGILTELSIEYFKKSRGTITGECRCEVPTENISKTYIVTVELKNAAGESVCRARATWKVGPV
jgi:acyl-coenzyme A thioesterase PaaI-like protein